MFIETEEVMESACKMVYHIDAKLLNMQNMARTFAILALGDVEQEYNLNRHSTHEAYEVAGGILLLAAMNLLTMVNEGKLEPVCIHFDGIQSKDGMTFPTQTAFLMMQDEVSGKDTSGIPDVSQYVKRTPTKRKGQPSKSITPSKKKRATTVQGLQEQLDSQLDPELQEAIRESKAGGINTTMNPQKQEANTAQSAPSAMPEFDPVATLHNAKVESGKAEHDE